MKFSIFISHELLHSGLFSQTLLSIIIVLCWISGDRNAPFLQQPKGKGSTGYIAQTIRNEDLSCTNWTHTKKGWQTYCVRKTRTIIEFVSCHFASALNNVTATMSVLEVKKRKLLSWHIMLGRGRDPCKHEIYNSKEFNGGPLGSQ